MNARRSGNTASVLFLALGVATAACRSPIADPSRREEARPPAALSTADVRAEAAAAPGATPYVKPDDAELRRRLTPLQYQVTQREATEPPFRNSFWDNHAAGLYVDVATGEPLFSSADKFESGTGWPSFTRPVDDNRVKDRRDDSLGTSRVEVRSAAGDSHLGHVFDDGPAPTNKRYCINSAALRFIPVDRLQAEGYGAYVSRFSGAQSSLPPSTKNSCAAPAPGEKPGCSATLDSATLVGPGRIDGLRLVDGVLEVSGPDGGRGDARVTYDPSRLTLAALVDRWKVLGGTAGAASP